MKPTHIHLKTGQIKQLKAIARQTGAPVAELVRRAIDEFVERRGEAAEKASYYDEKKADEQ